MLRVHSTMSNYPTALTEEKIKTTCPYCGVGCGVIAQANKQGQVTIEGDTSHPANSGRLCSKGSALGETVNLSHRLLSPMVNNKKASWDEALAEVANCFVETINNYGADSVAFYVSGQLLTEDYYVANKLMKGFIGSANIDTNSRLCMSSAVAGHKRAFGSDAVGPCYEDLESAEAIIVTGSNIAWCHPVLYQRIEAARENNDCQLYIIDPRQTHSCDTADVHLPIRPGTDAVLFNGLLCYLEQHACIDHEYINAHTQGFDAALTLAKQTAPSIEFVAKACDVSVEKVEQFYQLFSNTEKVVTLFSMGINQSSSGVDKVNAIINAHLAAGKIGKPGTGPFSITGQPNAMGGREVGGLASTLAAHMDFEQSECVARFWNSDKIAIKPGLKAVDLFNDIKSGKVKAVWVMATNPAVSIPDSNSVNEALKQCDFVVVSDCIRKTDTTRYADVLLPAAAWGEKSGTVTNSERRISRQRSFLSTAGEARPDWWIISEVAKRMGFGDEFQYQHVADVFREHAALSGFENAGNRDFDISLLQELDNEDYDALKPIQWPVNQENPEGTRRILTNGHFYTKDNKARFIPIEPRTPGANTSDTFPLVLNTGRVRDHWHTMTRTGESQRLSRHSLEPFAQCHPATAKQFAIKDKQLIRINSEYGSVVVRAELTDRQRQDEIFIPLHWNDQFSANARVDAVVNPFVDPISGQPEYKHTPVKVEPVKHEWFGFILSRHEYQFDELAYWTKLIEKDNWRIEFSDKEIKDINWFKKRIQNGHDYDWIEYVDEYNQTARYLWQYENEIQGCIFTATDYASLPAREWLSEQFSTTTLQDNKWQILAGLSSSGGVDTGSVVCSCFGVGENTIKDYICENAKADVNQIGKALNAGTNCGSCRPEIKSLIENRQHS